MRFIGVIALFACVVLPMGCSGKKDDISMGQDPDLAAHAARDQGVFEQLKRLKVDFAKPRDTLFYFYFPSEGDASAALTELKATSIGREAGFVSEVRKDGEGKSWLCLIRAEMVVNESRIAELRRDFLGIAKQNHGEYDGWECAADR